MTERLDFLGHVDTSGSAERARDAEVAIGPIDPTGPFVVAFADGDAVHEVALHRDGDDWHGDCWDLDEEATRTQRCRGLVYSDGPCAHLFAVRRAVARGEVAALDAEEERARDAVERIMADGGRRFRR